MKKITNGLETSSPAWDTLEAFARAQVQGFIQQLLEDEVDELLRRRKSERRAAPDAPRGSRNRQGKPRRLALMNGTIRVWRPLTRVQPRLWRTRHSITAAKWTAGHRITRKVRDVKTAGDDHGMSLVRQFDASTTRSVSVRGDTVVKTQEPGASRKERLRTLAGREVGQRTGLFVVPEIVSFDDSRGEIVFERLTFTRLREALSDAGRSMDLVGRVAATLAAIHGSMQAIEGATTIASGGMNPGPERNPVPLHGDFGMRNVFYLSASNHIAVIDWSNAVWMGVEGDLGAPEIDIAVFLMSLFHRRLFGRWPISRRHDVARHFLATYASASPHGLDIDTLGRIVAASTPGFNQQTRRLKGSLRALGYRHNMPDLSLFVRRLSSQRFAGRGERRVG